MCDVRSSAWPGEREDKYHQSALSAVHQEEKIRHLDLTLRYFINISKLLFQEDLFLQDVWVLHVTKFILQTVVSRIEVCNTTLLR